MTKPYSSDVLVTLLILLLTVRAAREEKIIGRWYVLLALLTPLAVFFSYPAIFVLGGASLYLLWYHVRGQQIGRLPCWLVFNMVCAGSFLGFFFLLVRPNVGGNIQWFAKIWANAFPPFTSPGEFLGWLWEVHTGVLLAYPVGGEHSGSILTFLLCLYGIVVLAGEKKRGLFFLLLAPFFFNFIAAAMHRYPYGGMTRLVLYAAPMVALCAGAALGTIFADCNNHRWKSIAARLTLTALFLIAAASIGRDIAKPYRDPEEVRLRAFSQWFWNAAAMQGRVVSVQESLGLDRGDFRVAKFLCYKKVYASDRRKDAAAGSEGAVTRYVYYRASRTDDSAYMKWLKGLPASCTRTEPLQLPLEYRMDGGKIRADSMVEIVSCR